MTTTRHARCSCGHTEPSNPDRQFAFTDMSEGSTACNDRCANCAYSPIAHTDEVRNQPHNRGRICDNFTPTPGMEFDRFYCGCRGWD